ncbi:MAG TPA: hypothetical protein VIT20_04880 [Propionibacteriaceae bacterium]
MEVNSSSNRLGCGRDIDEVWNNAERPPDAHELSCSDCQAARSSLVELTSATERLRQEEVEDESLQTSPQVIERILAIARSEVRRGRRLPLNHPGAGQESELTVSEQAVASVIRRVGDRSGWVEIRRCSIELVDGEPLADAPASEVRVFIRVSIKFGGAIAEVIDELRSTIIDTVDREVGLTVIAVDVTVEDVHDA